MITNKRIKELELEAIAYADSKVPAMDRYNDIYHSIVRGKFAELIVNDCKENFAKVWYEQGLDIRGAEIGKFLTRFDEHFGVEE